MDHFVHCILFYVPGDRSRRPKSHHGRDGIAQMQLLPALIAEGFQLGETFLNYPPFPFPGEDLSPSQYTEFDLECARPGDLLLLTTRPPLDDVAHGNRKRVYPGYTNLELALEPLWRKYFRTCARSHVELSEEARKGLRQGFENYAEMEVRVNGGSELLWVNGRKGDGFRRPTRGGSVAFMLRVDEAWAGGPGFLAVFAMEGDATLAWANILRREYRDLIHEPGFFMFALEPPAERDHRGPLSSIANEWKAELALESRLS